MAVVEDRIVRPVGFLDLVEALGDEEGLQPIARHEGQGGFEEVETTQGRELVEQHQQATTPCPRMEILGQASSDLVQDQTDQRLGAADVRRRHHQVEGDGPFAIDQVADAPVATPGHRCDNRVAIEAEEAHRGREHARPLVLALVQQFAGGGGDHGMRSPVTMRRRHHPAQGGFDRAFGI
ncbi:hypothetical protein D3C73_930330 [compost metagenome]